MQSRLMPLLAILALTSFALERQTASAQQLNSDNQGLEQKTPPPKLPSLSIEGMTGQSEILRNSSDLKGIAGSIRFDRHRQENRGRSTDPLQYFQPPPLPSSLKVPVDKF